MSCYTKNIILHRTSAYFIYCAEMGFALALALASYFLDKKMLWCVCVCVQFHHYVMTQIVCVKVKHSAYCVKTAENLTPHCYFISESSTWSSQCYLINLIFPPHILPFNIYKLHTSTCIVMRRKHVESCYFLHYITDDWHH